MQRLTLLVPAFAMLVGGCSLWATGSDAGIGQKELQKATWTVAQMPGDQPDSATLTLNFHDGDQLSGKAACNNYMASYTLEGDQLAISPTATTRMACPEPLMSLEQNFLGLLENVKSVQWEEQTEQLVLTTENDQQLRATR